jgi:prepilin-type N-terminal cleavage/methylation domain-containing protein
MGVRWREAGGFTLLELIFVISLLGLLLAMVIPGTARYLHSTALAGSASTLVSDIRYARSLATSQRRTYEILFTANGYDVRRVSPAASVRSRTLPRGVTFTASDTTMFYPWGLTDAVTLQLAGREGTSVVRIASNGNVTRD